MDTDPAVIDTATPDQVNELRKLLDAADVPWSTVRDYPRATYLIGLLYTVWWQGDHFAWGHEFEHHDGTAQSVVARLGSLDET